MKAKVLKFTKKIFDGNTHFFHGRRPISRKISRPWNHELSWIALQIKVEVYKKFATCYSDFDSSSKLCEVNVAIPTIALPVQQSPHIDQPHSPSPTASGSTQPFCHSTLSGQTDIQTHRPTDGLGDRSVWWALTLAVLIQSDALIILTPCTIFRCR